MTTPAALAKHIDFTGYEVGIIPDAPELKMPVRAAGFGDDCEICDEPALYILDAGALGDAGHSPTFCQTHMDSRVFVHGPEAGEVWTVKA